MTDNDLRLTDEVVEIMAQFVRDMTTHKCAVIGMVYCTQPQPAMGTLRNVTGDIAVLFQKATEIVKCATEDGRIENVDVLPLS